MRQTTGEKQAPLMQAKSYKTILGSHVVDSFTATRAIDRRANIARANCLSNHSFGCNANKGVGGVLLGSSVIG